VLRNGDHEKHGSPFLVWTVLGRDHVGKVEDLSSFVAAQEMPRWSAARTRAKRAWVKRISSGILVIENGKN
jgi:hypothetical protein